MVAPLVMAALASPLVKELLANGLSLLGNAIMAKGKAAVEDKLGVKLPDENTQLTSEQLERLRGLQFDHEETLIELAIKQKQIELGGEKVASEAVTKRWEADMLSDSYLSKNVRPIALLSTLGGVFLLACLSAAGVAIADPYVKLFGELLQIMVGAYFVGRTVEKGIDVYQGWKQTQGN